MIQETASPAAVENLERRFVGPVKIWELVFLVVFTAALLATLVIQSRKEFFGHDELYVAILTSNPSLSEMLHTIRHGGETNPPLYYLLEWGVARVFGSGELALRAISGLSVALAGWVLFFTIRPLGGPRVAALAVALIFGLSRDVFVFMTMARYYGLLLLLVALGAFLVITLSGDRPVKRRDYWLIFLLHASMIYVHLYGLFYSGVLFAAMVAVDWLRGRLRWGLYAVWVAAWATFLGWLPSTLQQLKLVTSGVYTPPGYYTLGFFMEELALQIPLAVILLLVVLLGGLALLSARPCRAGEEAGSISTPIGWIALALVALALMSVPVGTWLFSQVRQPPLYMRRYIFPCTTAWVLVVALMLIAMLRLRLPGHSLRARVSPRFCELAWFSVLVFCVLFQPLRARKNPGRPAQAFTDEDYGYKNLPMVFEGSWGFVHRVVYGQGRRYIVLIDQAAAQASTGWYTKMMEVNFRAWYPRYQKAEIAHCADLPDEFLAVDDDTGKTFEWVFQHHSEFKTRLLGTQPANPKELGEQRTYLVQRVPVAKDSAP